MKLYFAVGPNQIQIDILKQCGVKNILTSFAFTNIFDKFLIQTRQWIPENLILDSGAFSVWTKGNIIDIDKYVQFCIDSKQKCIDSKLYFVNLDVLPGKFGEYPDEKQREESAEKGWENMLYLESKGLKVIPVFHQHEDFKWLDRIREHTDYIGISPANDVSSKMKEKWLEKVFSITRDTIKTHGFGITSFPLLKKFPFYSVDSTSWVASGRFASMHVFQNGNFRGILYKKDGKFDSVWRGLDEKDSKVLTEYRKRLKQSIIAFLQAEEFLTNIWTKRGIVWNEN